jgi:hypothetical protein
MTTFAAIRAGYIATIRALVPRILSADRFRPSPHELALDTYAQDEKARASLFRMFQIRDSHDDAPTTYTDLHTVRVAHSCTVDVAYPKDFGIYGRDDLLSMDDVIRSDFVQIDEAIGITGAASWQSGQHMSDNQGNGLIDIGPAVIRRIVFRLEYDRSFGGIP